MTRPLIFIYLLSISFTAALESAVPFTDLSFANNNSKNVANNLNDLSASGALAGDPSLSDAVDLITALPYQEQGPALDQLQPAIYSAFSDMQAALGGQLLSTFHHRPSPYCCCGDSSYRAWLDPYGNWLKEKEIGEQTGFYTNSKGLTFGVEKELLEGWFVGGGGAWNHARITWGEGKGFGMANTYYGAFYTDYTTDNYYLGFSLLAGVDAYSTVRQIQFSTLNERARGTHYGTEVMAQFAGAAYFGPQMCFAFPYINVDLMYLRQNSFQESGAEGLDLSIPSNSQTTLRTEAGFALQVVDVNKYNTCCISPLFSLGWAMECPLYRETYKTNFQGQSIPFEADGWNYTWQLFTVRFGLTFTYRCFSLFSGYTAELSPLDNKPYFDQRGDIRFEYNW